MCVLPAVFRARCLRVNRAIQRERALMRFNVQCAGTCRCLQPQD